jgi:hypothetical protein
MSNVPFVINKIVKIEGDRPIYCVTIEGHSFEIRNADDLIYFRRFRRVVFKRTGRFLPHIPTDVWEDYLNQVLAEIEIIEPPDKEEARAARYHQVNSSQRRRTSSAIRNA